MNRSLACLALCLVAGCPQPVEPMDDAPPPMDGGVDTPSDPDAGDLDGDDDGVPATEDCNDADPAIGSSGSRSCEGPCGPGVEACIAGEWRSCEASTDCLCAVDGMTRTMPCGTMCGTRTDTCTAMRWVEGATCDGEGVCEPDAVEMMSGERCLVTRRVCGADCAWGATEVVVPMGECEPGYISCGLRIRCNEACVGEAFETDPRCT